MFPLRPQSSKTLLYIGYDRKNYSVLRRLALEEDIRITAIRQGKEAVAVVKGLMPDFIVMETVLSDANSLDLCAVLRADPSIPPIPILFCIPSRETATEIMILQAGGDGFLAKPLEYELLSAYVGNLLRRHDAQVKNYRLLKNLEKYISHRARERAGQRHPEKLTATVLFTDLRGFTESTVHGKIEDVFRSISALQTRQITIVHRYGGYVDKFTGDGLLAVFDLSTDHVGKACEAALAIRQSLQDGKEAGLWRSLPPIGMGIHSGKLLRGDIGGPEHMDFSVIGSTVNIAARLCGQAQPSEIVVSGAIVRRVKSRFALADTRMVDLKGLGRIRVYLLE